MTLKHKELGDPSLHWCPPLDVCLKVNADGSWNRRLGAMGLGCCGG